MSLNFTAVSPVFLLQFVPENESYYEYDPPGVDEGAADAAGCLTVAPSDHLGGTKIAAFPLNLITYSRCSDLYGQFLHTLT